MVVPSGDGGGHGEPVPSTGAAAGGRELRWCLLSAKAKCSGIYGAHRAGVGLSPRFIGTESAGPWGARGGPQVGGGRGW